MSDVQVPAVVEKVIGDRFSCRAFLPDEVPQRMAERMFAMAQQAPSWCNTQPWTVHLLSGEATRRFADELTGYVRTHERRSDLEQPAEYRGVYRTRRREAGYALYRSVGIDRADMDARREQGMLNYRFFGAPHTAVITSDRFLGPYGAVDCGSYVATLLIAAQSLGVATIAQAAIAQYSDFVREYLDLPDDRVVVCAVSFGFADMSHPANGFRTTRAELGDVVTRI